MSRFAEEITLSKTEAGLVLDVLHSAVEAFEAQDLFVESAEAHDLIELIQDRLTPLGLNE